MKLFDSDHFEKRSAVQARVFQAFYAFGANAEEFLHLIIPAIVRTIERSDVKMSLRVAAVRTIDGLSRKVNFCDHASRIIHPLARVLATGNAELRAAVMDTLCVLLVQLGSEYAIFVPMINKVAMITLLSCLY